MRWWNAKPGSTGTAQSMVPEMCDPQVTIGSITYKQKFMSDGRVYHSWTCPFCETEVGSCLYGGALRRAVVRHMSNCRDHSCGQEACIRCTPAVVVVVDAV